MSDYDSYDGDEGEDGEQSIQIPVIQIPHYRLQAQDVVGIAISTLAGCLHQVSLGVQAIGNEILADGNYRRRQEFDLQARAEAAAAMGIIPETGPEQ